MGRIAKRRRDTYGAWLLHLRKQKKLSQTELSALTGVPQRTIAHWEQTGALTGRRIIIKLANALDVSIEDLLRVGHGKS